MSRRAPFGGGTGRARETRRSLHVARVALRSGDVQLALTFMQHAVATMRLRARARVGAS